MTLYIKEIAWGIDPQGLTERVTAEVAFPCAVGPLPPFRQGRRCFAIDRVEEAGIRLSVHYERNPAADKHWDIGRGERLGYRPRSFDGGYRYEFEVR